MGLGFEQLEAQGNGQQLFKQFLDELKDLKQQLRAQQEQHRQIVQRLQLGMDERDQKCDDCDSNWELNRQF